MSIIVEIPDDVIASARLSAADIQLEIALALYASRRLSFGKAREFAQKSVWEFRQIASVRGITVDLDEQDLEDEVASLRRIGRL